MRRSLGYAPQAVDLPDDLSARTFALHIAALKGLELAAADEQFGAITDVIGLHPDINDRIITYSGGMRRRLIFAQALLGAPRLFSIQPLLLALATGAGASAVATGLSALSRSAFAPRLVLLVLWYFYFSTGG